MSDTDDAAVERLAAGLESMTLFTSYDDALIMERAAAATLRALIAERAALRQERDAARAALRPFIEAADPAMLVERDHPHRVFREARLAAGSALGEPAA